MKYEVYADRKFTEEDVASLVEQDLLGEKRPFVGVVLLSGGTLVVRLERTLQELSNEKRIESILRQALHGMSGKMWIRPRGN